MWMDCAALCGHKGWRRRHQNTAWQQGKIARHNCVYFGPQHLCNRWPARECHTHTCSKRACECHTHTYSKRARECHTHTYSRRACECHILTLSKQAYAYHTSHWKKWKNQGYDPHPRCVCASCLDYAHVVYICTYDFYMYIYCGKCTFFGSNHFSQTSMRLWMHPHACVDLMSEMRRRTHLFQRQTACIYIHTHAFIHMCVCVYMYIYVYIYIYIYIHICNTCTLIYKQTCRQYKYTHTYAYTTYMNGYIRAYIYTYTHTHICIYIHTYMYTRTGGRCCCGYSI